MTRGTLLVIGICSSVSMTPVIAGDSSGNTAFDGSVGAAAGNQMQGDAGAPEAATTKGKAAPQRKIARTGTLLRYIYDQDKKGNIKIEGMTDTAPPP